jgi:hypothetical protein
MSTFKDVALCVVSKINGARVWSHTTAKNAKAREAMLRYNVSSINGQGTAIFERFVPFGNHTENDYIVERYNRVA